MLLKKIPYKGNIRRIFWNNLRNISFNIYIKKANNKSTNTKKTL